MRNFVFDFIPGLVGAFIGGILGYFAFRWVYGYGFYAMVLPGALVGLGGGLLSNTNSRVRGVICAFGALGLSLYIEWQFMTRQPTFLAFLQNVSNAGPITFIMIALGTILGYRWGGESIKPGLSSLGPKSSED